MGVAGEWPRRREVPQAAGADAMREGMALFREAAGNLARVGVEQKKGNLFEYILARPDGGSTSRGTGALRSRDKCVRAW